MVDFISASEVRREFRNGHLDVAALTLDETRRLAQASIEFKIVLVTDVSHSVDVLMATSDIGSIAELRGRRIGVEASAVGACLLDRALAQAGMQKMDVSLKHFDVDQRYRAFVTGDNNAVVTFKRGAQ